MTCPLCGEEHEQIGTFGGIPVYTCPQVGPYVAGTYVEDDQ